MLSKSAAKAFFLVGTGLCAGAFLLLTVDTLKRVPQQTHADRLTPEVIQGKHLWEKNNCMGCHTLMGEGAYYAPELTKVYTRRGPDFIKAMLTDPQAMYPGRRKMQQYHFTDEEKLALVEFLKWVGEVDLNGFPKDPDLAPVALPSGVARSADRPKVLSQMCLACHMVQGQGGQVGPALDGVGSRKTKDEIANWLRDPQAVKPDSKMPKLPLTEADIVELSAYLSQLKAGE